MTAPFLTAAGRFAALIDFLVTAAFRAAGAVFLAGLRKALTGFFAAAFFIGGFLALTILLMALPGDFALFAGRAAFTDVFFAATFFFVLTAFVLAAFFATDFLAFAGL